MNIVFWSNMQGRCGTTTNAFAISVMASLVYSIHAITMHTYGDSKLWEMNLDTGARFSALSSDLLREDFAYYNCRGLDDIIESSRLRNISADSVKPNMIKVRNLNMHYIPTSKRMGIRLNDEEVAKKLPEIMKVLKKMAELCVIDVHNGNDRISISAINQADVVAVNLSQDDIGNSMFYQIPERIKEKCVYLVGRYNSRSEFHVDMLRKKYRLNKEDICTIPYSVRFYDAMNAGNALRFFSKNLYIGSHDENFEFMESVYLATNMILRKAGYDV